MPRPLCLRHAGRGKSTDHPFRLTTLAGKSSGGGGAKGQSNGALRAPAPEGVLTTARRRR